MIEFLWWYMALLLPLPLLVAIMPPSARHLGAALKMPVGTVADDAELTLNHKPQLSKKRLLLWLIWLLTVIALMRPQWTGDPVALPVSGRDLLLAVDVSGSMNQEDMELNGIRVSRLTMVKEIVADFILQRTGDRIGLILFGTHAYLQAPLTFDRKTIGELLKEVPAGVAGGKTAVGNAIGLGIKQLSRKEEADDRILVLLTDGASNAGELDPVKAAQLATIENIRIYTIGVGGNKKNITGPFGAILGLRSQSTSNLDEKTLKQIAKLTNGHYFYADSAEKLKKAYELLNDYEPVVRDTQIFRPIRSLSHYPLGLAFILSLLLAGLLLQGQMSTQTPTT